VRPGSASGKRREPVLELDLEAVQAPGDHGVGADAQHQLDELLIVVTAG
jgi:hypothetical protein